MSEEPSYEEQYQKALDELDAAAGGQQPAATTATPEQPGDEPAATAEPPQQELPTGQSEETAEQRLTRIQAELEKAHKALQDTQRWGHEKAAEAARLRREQEQALRAAKRPELLQEIPELEGAVDHVLADRMARERQEAEQAEQKAREQHEQNLRSVIEVHEDVPQLLSDPDFYGAMAKRREAIGAEKFDSSPALMIREITAEKLERARRASEAEKQAAIAAARQEAEKAAKAKAGMTMPGAAAGGRAAPSAGSLSPEDVWNMSEADFRRMTAKVTGF